MDMTLCKIHIALLCGFFSYVSLMAEEIIISGTVSDAISISSGDYLTIQSGGNFLGPLNINGGTIENHGTLSPSSWLINSSERLVIKNHGTIDFIKESWLLRNIEIINYDIINFRSLFEDMYLILSDDSEINNHEGYISINGSLMVESESRIFNGGTIVIYEDFTNQGEILGPAANCGLFQVYGISRNEGLFGLSGIQDICDYSTSSSQGFDSNTGTDESLDDHCACMPVLAIDLLNFRADVLPNNTVKLTFLINTDDVQKEYILQKSENGNLWSNLTSFYKGENPAITYIDADPVPGFNYYRLRTIDENGLEDFSRVISLRVLRSNEKPFEFFPNPAGNFVTMKVVEDALETNYYLLELLDGMMRPLQKKVLDTSASLHIDLRNIPPGLYFVRITAVDKLVQMERIIRR